MTKENRGPFMTCYPSGIDFYPMDPRPEEVSIEDIANALSKVCRFGGHVSEFYSVAQHSVHVLELVERGVKSRDLDQAPALLRAALLHDAAEAYGLGDVLSPFKGSVNMWSDRDGGWSTYARIEVRMLNAIFTKLKVGVNPGNAIARRFIMEADTIALATEARGLKNCTWELGHPPEDKVIVPLGPDAARRAFLAAWERIKPC